MRRIFASMSDVIAAEGKYHLKCYVSFSIKYDKHSEGKSQSPRNKCFRNVMTELEEMEKRRMLTLITVWDHYSKLMSQDVGIGAGVYNSYNFQQSLKLYYGGDSYIRTAV